MQVGLRELNGASECFNDMESLFYVMAIMGCADGSDQCREQRVEQARFSSIQACQAAMPAALERNSDLSYPVISAACRANGPRMVERSASVPRG